MSSTTRTILVTDAGEIQKLATTVPTLTSGFDGANRYVPVLTTGRNQLFILLDGKPIISYRVATDEGAAAPDQGMRAILGYVDSIQGNKHLVMLYDDPHLAREIEFFYLKQGLEKWNEQCFYLLPSDDVETIESIREQMEKFGIETRRHIKNRSLRIEKIADPSQEREGFRSGCDKIFSSLTKLANRPSRVVLHVKYKFDTEEEIREHAEFEEAIQSSIARFNGSVLCNHYVGHNDESKHSVWRERMLRTHDNVFLVSRSIQKIPGF